MIGTETVLWLLVALMGASGIVPVEPLQPGKSFVAKALQPGDLEKLFIFLHIGATRNNILEQQVLNLLEDFRQLMITGTDDVPILDPLQVENLHVDDNVVDLPGAHLTVNELLVKYASTFVVDRLSISLIHIIFQHYSVEFELHIPVLDVEAGDYDLFVSAMGFEIFGKGDGKVQLIGAKVSGSAVFALWTLSLSETNVRIGIDGFEPQLTGLFHHDGASDFANSFLRNLVPELVEFYENDITAFLSPILEDLANQVLGDIFSQFFSMPLKGRNDKIQQI